MIVSASGIPRFTHRTIGDDFALTWAHLKCAPVRGAKQGGGVWGGGLNPP